MRLKTWWKYAVFKYDIIHIEDTVLDYLKFVTFRHPDYQKPRVVVSHIKNIEL